MADIIIPDVPDDVIAAIDVRAQRLGLSRNDYLRQPRSHERIIQSSEVSVEDLAGFARAFVDLDAREIMNRAWR